MERLYKVFVSSTLKDLEYERQQVFEALIAAKCFPVSMEGFPADPSTPDNLIVRMIDSCDLFVLLIAGKYGSLTKKKISYTEAEFRHAERKKMPIFVFPRHKDSIPKGDKFRDPPRSALAHRLDRLRRDASKRTTRSWKNSNDLKLSILTTMDEYRDNAGKLGDQGGWIRASEFMPTCPYVKRFSVEVEPPLLTNDGTQKISGERAYRLLRFMFEKESFARFRALDLAIERWEEATDDDGQTINISDEVLEAIQSMLAKKRCRDFRRIFVANEDYIRCDKGQKILSHFIQKEQEWRKNYKGVTVETRVLIFPNPPKTLSDRKLTQQIAKLHDFALFIRPRAPKGEASAEMAIIETGLSKPGGAVDTRFSEFQLTRQTDKIQEREDAFMELWEPSKPMSAFLYPRPSVAKTGKARRKP